MMSNQSFDGIKSDSDQISTDDAEDKKFVSQAVAFVIGHARNGFVSLCASVASLLKEQTRLKLEVETLQQEVSDLKESLSRHNDPIRCTIKEFGISNKKEICNESVLTKSNIMLPESVSKKQQGISDLKESLSELNESTKCTIKEFNISNKKAICNESLLTKSNIMLSQSVSKKHQGISDLKESLSELNESIRCTTKEFNTSDEKEFCNELFLTTDSVTLPQNISKKYIAINENKFSPDVHKSCDLIQLSKNVPYRKLKGCICSRCLVTESELPFTPPLQKGMKVVIRGEINGVVQYVGHVDSLDFPEIFVGLRFSEPIGDSDGSIYHKVYFSVPKNYGMFVPLPYVNFVIKDCNSNR